MATATKNGKGKSITKMASEIITKGGAISEADIDAMLANGKAKLPKGTKRTPKVEKPKATKAAPKAVKATKAEQPSNSNPYRVGGGYWASVEALRTLGVGKMHDQAAVIAAVRKAMGANWKEFAAKEARNEATAKDADGKAWVNVSVVARRDYGAKLREAGYEVRFDGREKKAGLFRVGK